MGVEIKAAGLSSAGRGYGRERNISKDKQLVSKVPGVAPPLPTRPTRYDFLGTSRRRRK